jgi:hypothetical protein
VEFVLGGVYYIDGIERDGLSLTLGKTYAFDISDPSMGSHPLRFSATPDGIHNGGIEWTEGLTVQPNIIYLAVDENTPNPLYYYCAIHPNMGGTITIVAPEPEPESQVFQDGLTWSLYNGIYFADDLTLLSGTPTSNGTTNAISNVDFLTGHAPTQFSADITGYFKPDVSGTWSFSLTSDDASYLWLPAAGGSNDTTASALINNGGLHGSTTVSQSIALNSNVYYPIRIVYGQDAGAATLLAEFTPPGGSATADGTGYYFSMV